LSNRVEPEIPNITLDHDQVKAINTSRSTHTEKNKSVNEPANTQTKSSTASVFFTVLIYLALAGGSWFFYQENLKLQHLISDSESRIQQLENQLSATGEEMGESTIALKVKLEAISEKTEKLWDEMDKLWASAWRKNQSEIKALRSTSMKQDTLNTNQSQQLEQANTAINTVSDNLTSTEFNITALADQITAANNMQPKIAELNSLLSTLEEKSSGRDTQQMEVATSVNQLEMSITLLIERLEKIESQSQKTITPTL
jgi:chromosome segregation ATPase